MLTCPYCKNPLRDSDVAREVCPHCQQSVRPGLGTIDSDSGGVTLVLPPEAARRDSTITREGTTTQADAPRPSPILDSADETPSTGVRGMDRTLDSAESFAAANDPRVTRTFESTDVPNPTGSSSAPSDPLDSPRKSGYDATLDSSVASDQPGVSWHESADSSPANPSRDNAGKASDSPR
ncbi:MAG: hypothetical protein MUF06_23560, partial [Pirellulaceae bacterium]|nr:hypothetical protein [Pirellulaceae bacterium]